MEIFISTDFKNIDIHNLIKYPSGYAALCELMRTGACVVFPGDTDYGLEPNRLVKNKEGVWCWQNGVPKINCANCPEVKDGGRVVE